MGAALPKPLRDVSEKQARRILALVIAVSTFGFSCLAYLKYACFSWETSDIAFYGYAFNQTLKGRFFPLFVREGSLLGNHPNFLQLLWLPAFWAFPTIYCLLLFQSLAICLAAWPIYLLARKTTGNRLTALIAATGLLVFPPIVGQHVSQIHDDQFGLALLLFALYYFEVGDLRRFGLFLGLSLLAKETMAFSALAFGVYALVRRRGWKWTVLPVAVSAIYLVLALGFLMPRWGVEINRLYESTAYFSDYGHSPREVLSFIWTHPLQVLARVFGLDRMRYLARLLRPLAFVLPFGNWSWLLAAPTLGINLLGSNDLLRDSAWHYNLIPGGLLWASFVSAIPSWNKTLGRWFGDRDYARGLCLITLFLSLASCSLWLAPSQFQRSPMHNARLEAINAVPRNATVVCPENMLAHFADHPALNSLGQLSVFKCDINRVFDYDYMVFDMTAVGLPDWEAQGTLYGLVSKRSDWYQLVFSRDGVHVFRRVGTPRRVLRNWPAAGPPSTLRREPLADGGLAARAGCRKVEIHSTELSASAVVLPPPRGQKRPCYYP